MSTYHLTDNHPNHNFLPQTFIFTGKAANAGGVAVSGLEMAQNSGRISWDFATLDAKLKEIMYNCYDDGFKVGKEYSENGGVLPSLQVGSNIVSFFRCLNICFFDFFWWCKNGKDMEADSYVIFVLLHNRLGSLRLRTP